MVRPASVAGRDRLARADSRLRAVRAPGARRPARRRVHPRRPRVGAGEDAARDRDRGRPGRGGDRHPLGDGAGRRAGVRGRGRGGPRRRAERAVRAHGDLARPLGPPDLCGRAHRLRHRAARPLGRRFATGPAWPAGRDPRGPGHRDRPGRRAGVLRRRAGGHGAGSPAERADLAAAGCTRPAARLRLGGRVGGAAGGRGRERRRRPRGHLPHRRRHAHEHLRAEPRDAPRARPWRRLLAADDEPVPRGDGGARVAARRGRGRRRGNCPDRGAGGLLLRADRAAGPARARAVRVHDPPLRGDRRRRGRRPERRRRDDAASCAARDHRRQP